MVRRVEKIETAVEPRFQEHFVEAMAIPAPDGPVPEPRPRSSPLPAAPSRRDGRRRRTPAGDAADDADAAVIAAAAQRREDR